MKKHEMMNLAGILMLVLGILGEITGFTVTWINIVMSICGLFNMMWAIKVKNDLEKKQEAQA